MPLNDKIEIIALNKPKTLRRTLNTVLLSWRNVFSNNEGDTVYKLELESLFHDWKPIYWGPKQEFLVENLTPCSFYNFRLKYYNDDDHHTSEWLYFKSGTDSIPYFAVHFTRAVKFAKTSVVRKILNRRPILLETENKEGKTPLIQAIENGSLQMATFLINLGANVNTATLITKRTPLMVALFNGNLQISNLLLDKGANLWAKDCNLLTGLHHAIDSGSLETVQLCLDHGFDVNAKDISGWTPLLRAVVLECPDSIVTLLLSKEADVAVKDRNGFDFYKHLEMSRRINLKELIEKNVEDSKKEHE